MLEGVLRQEAGIDFVLLRAGDAAALVERKESPIFLPMPSLLRRASILASRQALAYRGRFVYL